MAVKRDSALKEIYRSIAEAEGFEVDEEVLDLFSIKDGTPQFSAMIISLMNDLEFMTITSGQAFRRACELGSKEYGNEFRARTPEQEAQNLREELQDAFFYFLSGLDKTQL